MAARADGMRSTWAGGLRLGCGVAGVSSQQLLAARRHSRPTAMRTTPAHAEHDGDNTLHKHDTKPVLDINWKEVKRVSS